MVINATVASGHCHYPSSLCFQMDSVVQNGWDQRTNHYLTSISLTLLYYDYALTFDREFRLFWSRRTIGQWGSVLFFVNRYCGVLGHVPVFIQMFPRPKSVLYHLCKPEYLYHEILAVVMQLVIGLTFITRTYALYDRSPLVLAGLMSLALTSVAIGGYMMSQGRELAMDPELPEGSVGCLNGLSWTRSWRLAAAWCSVMIFDLVVAIMTLLRTMKISRRSRADHMLTYVLMRDGALYFTVMCLVSLFNIITFLFGSEITRGDVTTTANILGCVLVSRLMFNLREPQGHPATATETAVTTSAPTTSTVLQYTLTDIDNFDETAVHESVINQDIEMVGIADHSKREGG
ncbi:hypothetical protein BJ322DRAFT_491912 [Thelephora terrestris]|uniref:DUF6533 domain-containing protein n=1 Tax=Thelephora terrestris TaxID=56493 RepID=A0A9P6L175_9AGAM|nr:hypothetical protein BJ322DRAFT_491912 [Thelephora terrestris]